MEHFTAPIFREATNSDDESLTQLERSANLRALGHIFPPGDYPYPTDEVRKRWQTLLRDPTVCVGVSEDAAGLTSLVAFDDGLVRHLAVRPDRWGTGTARAAMEWAISRTPVPRLWCLEENARALGFYVHLGWTRTGGRQRAEFPPYPFEVELVRPH